MVKRIGPRTEPWGTIECTGANSEQWMAQFYPPSGVHYNVMHSSCIGRRRFVFISASQIYSEIRKSSAWRR